MVISARTGSLQRPVAILQTFVLCGLIACFGAIYANRNADSATGALTLSSFDGQSPNAAVMGRTRGSKDLRPEPLKLDSNLLHVQAASWRREARFNPFESLDRLPRSFQTRDWDKSLPLFEPGAETRLSSPYGWRQLNQRQDFHGGVDFVAKQNTPVLTPVDGKVVWVNRSGYNGGVVISRPNRTYTFWHMVPDKALTVGQQVRKGQRIGRLANAGRRTHLHYAIHLVSDGNWKARHDKNSLDPLFLNATTGRL